MGLRESMLKEIAGYQYIFLYIYYTIISPSLLNDKWELRPHELSVFSRIIYGPT